MALGLAKIMAPLPLGTGFPAFLEDGDVALTFKTGLPHLSGWSGKYAFGVQFYKTVQGKGSGQPCGQSLPLVQKRAQGLAASGF